jgi:hypothetical protein
MQRRASRRIGAAECESISWVPFFMWPPGQRIHHLTAPQTRQASTYVASNSTAYSLKSGNRKRSARAMGTLMMI